MPGSIGADARRHRRRPSSTGATARATRYARHARPAQPVECARRDRRGNARRRAVSRKRSLRWPAFAGLARRFDVVGTSASRHHRDRRFRPQSRKSARATLRTLKAASRPRHRVLPAARLRPAAPDGPRTGRDLRAANLGPDDVTLLCDPVYFGGTVDRSEGSERIVAPDRDAGGQARIHADARRSAPSASSRSPAPATASWSWARATIL